MKKIVFVLACFMGYASFAQNIPADSLDFYRRSAHVLLIDHRVDEAVELYKKLALSGDALSGYQLYELYSQGKGVPKDPQEAEKWRSIAEETLALKVKQSQAKAAEKQSDESPHTLQEVLNESGRLIERGGREKNTAIIVGLAGGAVGGALITVGMFEGAPAASVAGGMITGGCVIAAFILEIVSNKHIKQGGELMRRVKITGEGISVSF